MNLTFFWSVFLLLKEPGLGPEDIAEQVEGLLYKQKGLSLVPSAHIKKLGMVLQMCNLRVEEIETDRSLGFPGQLA